MKARDIRKLRERLGLKQVELGKMLGVDQSTVSKWERGEPVSRMAQKALEKIWQEAA